MKKCIFLLLLLVSSLSYAETEYPLDTIQGEIVYKYPVEKSIGLYRIGINFQVSQEDIIRLNPQLQERGLRFGETIRIPVSKERLAKINAAILLSDSSSVATTETDSSMIETVLPDSLVMDSMFYDSIIGSRKVIELALMLPFESKQTKRSAQAERMTEFYQGVLLALHNAQNDSLFFRLRVYDTERSERRVVELCASNELDNIDGILGLAYPIQIEQMILWSEEHKVPLLLPFNDDTNLTGHTQVYLFNPSDKAKAVSLSGWIQGKADSIHCVAVGTTGNVELAKSVRKIHSQLKAKHIPYNKTSIHEILSDSLFLSLDSTKQNLIILHTDKYSRAHMLIPHIEKCIAAGYDIILFSQYSWQQENLQIPLVFTSIFEAEADTNDYEQLWNRYFINSHTSDLPRYDLLGYDLTNELLRIVNPNDSTNTSLQSDIVWTSESENDGFQNSKIQVVTYTPDAL